jgi:hypothetical protein
MRTGTFASRLLVDSDPISRDLRLLQLPNLLFQLILLPPQTYQFTLHSQNSHFKLYILPNQITPSPFQSRKVFSFIFLIHSPLSIHFCDFIFQSSKGRFEFGKLRVQLVITD